MKHVPVPAPERLVVIAIIGLALAACGLPLTGPVATPTGLSATDDDPDLITVTWDETTGADVYYVYRSLSADGPFAGPDQIPYRTVRQTTFLDIDVDPTTYYYAVSAGRLATGEESAVSAPVAGTRLATGVGWQDAATVFGAFGTLRIAVDRTAPTATAYVLTVGSGTGARAAVRRIEDDGTLTALDGPAEATDGTDTRVADLAAAGHLYIALVAEAPDNAADTDKVFLYRYDAAIEDWLLVTGSPLLPAHPAAPYVTVVAIGADDLLLGYRGANGQIVTYRYNGAFETLSAPSTTDDILSGEAGDAGLTVGLIDAAAVAGGSPGAVLLYELEDDTVANYGETVSLRASEWTGAGWTAGPPAIDAARVGSIAWSGAAVTIDPTVTPFADGVYIAYLDGPVVRIVDGAGAGVTDSAAGFPGIVNVDSAAVALGADGGIISLFYVDLVSDSGTIADFTLSTGLWDSSAPADFTQSAVPERLAVSAAGGKRFSAFDDGGVVRIRAYQ